MSQPSPKTLKASGAPAPTRKIKFRRRQMNTWQERRLEYLGRLITADLSSRRGRDARKEAEELSRIVYTLSGIPG